MLKKMKWQLRWYIPAQPTDTDILLRDGAEMMAAALERIDALEARESALIDTLAEIEALLTVHDTPIADTLVERIRILIQEAGYSA